MSAPAASSGAAPLFWLGTHEVSWLGRAGVPLLVSATRLRRRQSLPRARGPWALDSGGFTEVTAHAGWRLSAAEHVDRVREWSERIGTPDWAAPLDWMCEPVAIAATQLSVREHQERTVANLLELRAAAPEISWLPVLQGWTIGHYLRCVELYAQAGIDLRSERLVGVGSVCRRQTSVSTALLFDELVRGGITRLHGFGVKTTGLALYGDALSSCDSLAWSFNARRNPPMPGCAHSACSSCLDYALSWREELAGRGIIRDDHEPVFTDPRNAAYL